MSKDSIQELINQTINKNLNFPNPMRRKYSECSYSNDSFISKVSTLNKESKKSEEFVSYFDSNNNSETTKSTKSISLKIAIKLKGNVLKLIEINENDDAYIQVKKFCAENELSEDLVLPILAKVNESFGYYNDINNFDLNEDIEMVFKEALDIYNDYEKVESYLNDEILNDSFEDSLDDNTFEKIKKRGCSV